MAKIGYARIRTRDQNLDSQYWYVKSSRMWAYIFWKSEWRKFKRTELDNCLDYLRDGDTLVITKLDRLGWTTKQLIELSQHLADNRIDLETIDMNINTRDAMGKMFFTMMSGFAELEANLLNERTQKALNPHDREAGSVGGPESFKRQCIWLYRSIIVKHIPSMR